MKALRKWSPREGSREMEVSRPVTTWDPFREMEQEMATLWNRMDRMLGRWPMKAGSEGVSALAWLPRVDITEDEKEYLVKAELPEVKKEEIKVQVRDAMLSISGERQSEKEEKGRKFHRIERASGHFERSFMLPDEADVTKITSEFKDGVLTVHLPKNPGAAPKALEIKVE